MNAPLALTIPEAVAVSRLSRTRIYIAMKQGELTARKAGKRTIITTTELQRWLDSLPAYQVAA